MIPERKTGTRSRRGPRLPAVRALPILAFIGAPLVLFDTASARTVSCASTAELNAGYANAAPGDTFLLKPGTYSPDRPGQAKAGTAQKPIVVRGESPGTVTFSTEGEGIWHYPGWWVYENIRFNANGGDHSFHIKPGADGHLAWRNCHFYNCGDKAIKVDGDFSGAAGHWTDYLLVENCTMEVGQAGLMNNDGGDFCTCRNNYTYGFVDGGVNYIYFSKGGQAYTVFENNLCAEPSAWAGDRWAPPSSGTTATWRRPIPMRPSRWRIRSSGTTS
jgi:hypothetical protein